MQIKNTQLRKLLEDEYDDFDDSGEPLVINEEDLDNSKYNPANDAYLAMRKHLQGRMSAIARQISPQKLAMVKLAAQGAKTRQIADQTRVCPDTVLKTLKKPEVIELLELMHKYSSLMQGVTDAMKNAMLYRIAVRAELDEPKIAIAAIAELNRSAHNERTYKLNEKQGGTSQQMVVVQIGDARLKPSNLDQAPRHLIRDVN